MDVLILDFRSWEDSGGRRWFPIIKFVQGKWYVHKPRLKQLGMINAFISGN